MTPRTGRLLLLVVGFGAGLLAAAAAKRLAQRTPARGERAEHAAARPADAPDDDAWFVAERRSVQEVAEELDHLGYSQSYEKAGDRTGVTVHDAARAEAGLNLVLPAHEPMAALMDMDGKTLHAWRFPYRDLPGAQADELGNWRRVRLLPHGDLLALYDGHALIELDRDSKLRWSTLGDFHHDVDVVADGSLWVLARTLAVRPRFHPEAATVDDCLVHLDAAGRELERISLIDAFERSRYASFLDRVRSGGDIFHTNALDVLEGELEHVSPLFGAGKALVSVRNLDAVVLVDLARREVVWALCGPWRRQHDPVLLENGHLLVFDNYGQWGRSKVVELDPFTQAIAWSYDGNDVNDFFSRVCGACQRLANGDTLITESTRGRAFEVTPGGEVVWRFDSPYRVGASGEDVAVLFDVERLPREFPLDWLAQ